MRAFRTLMARHWVGWQDRSATRGLDDIQAYLGSEPLGMSPMPANPDVGEPLTPGDASLVGKHLEPNLAFLRTELNEPAEDGAERTRHSTILAAEETELAPHVAAANAARVV